jgi:hypothetical protein
MMFPLVAASAVGLWGSAASLLQGLGQDPRLGVLAVGGVLILWPVIKVLARLAFLLQAAVVLALVLGGGPGMQDWLSVVAKNLSP